MFNHLSIKGKLLSAFTATAFVAVIVGGVSFYYSSRTVGTYRNIAKNNVPNLEAFINMKAALVEMSIPIGALAGSNSTAEEASKAKAELEQDIADFQKASQLYEANAFAPGEEEFWNNFKAQHFKALVDLSEEMIRLSGTNNKADLKLRDKLWDTDYREQTKTRKEAFAKLVQFQLDDSKKSEHEGDALSAQMNLIVLVVVLVGFTFALVIGFALSNSLAKELTGVADALAIGSQEVGSAVTELSSAAEELSTASSEQAASVQETAASVDEINATVQTNAQSAAESAHVSDISKAKAENGKAAVERMVHSMGAINESNQRIQTQIEQSNQRIGEIIQVIQEIGTKTKVINDIVFQTKLLSFNASVEAARAGEHGKGFAVVAEEVGNLAQMSGASAKEITSLLDESIKKVESVVNESKQAVAGLMQQARDTVENGSKTATECGQTLEEIVRNVQQLSEMVGGISSASKEQSRGVEEISKAVREIDQATQSNASAAEQASSSANQLSAQVGALQNAADRLRLLVEGGSGTARAHTPSTQTAHHRSRNVLAFKPKAAAPRAAKSAEPSVSQKSSGLDALPVDSDPRFKEA